MERTIAGYGIKVQTDTGRWVWLTENSTSVYRVRAMRFDSEDGAWMHARILSKSNPGVDFKVEKL